MSRLRRKMKITDDIKTDAISEPLGEDPHAPFLLNCCRASIKSLDPRIFSFPSWNLLLLTLRFVSCSPVWSSKLLLPLLVNASVLIVIHISITWYIGEVRHLIIDITMSWWTRIGEAHGPGGFSCAFAPRSGARKNLYALIYFMEDITMAHSSVWWTPPWAALWIRVFPSKAWFM